MSFFLFAYIALLRYRKRNIASASSMALESSILRLV